MPGRERDDRPVRVAAAAPGPAAGALDLPATFGKYYLTEKLATGGMAEIYLAKIVGPGGFEKQLVIKQIHPRLSGQRHFVDLFVAEAKTLVTLAHGNVVPVYELGVIDDTYFIAMDYIDGPTLYRLTEALRRRAARMAPAIAAWITARVLEGLDYAHRKGEGVIHRDLSPRNVMLSRDGEVKLVDFGIAVTLGDGGEAEAGASAPTGSFPYMSPEQVRKQPLTGQTDLFSAGVLLWEMLVGHRLFARSDPEATLQAVIEGEIPRPSAEHPEIPARLDEVVMRALERDTAARWATAGDMLAALQRYLYSLDDPPGPRDVAALVARYCPPETRRLPTHHDELAELEAAGDVTHPRARAAIAAAEAGDAGEPPRPGPATAVIPRDAGPRGERPSRARTETFATHVELEQILEGAAPAAAAPAAGERSERPDDAQADTRGDAPAGRSRAERSGLGTEAAGANGDGADPDEAPGAPRDGATPVRPRAERSGLEAEAAGAAEEDRPIARPERAPLQLPGRTAPPMALLVVAAIGALVLGGAAVFVFYQGRAAIERPDAAPRRDALDDLAADAAATLTIAAPADAAPEPDAPGSLPPDAGRPALPAGAHDAGPLPPRPHPDAREPELTTRPDAGARPTGTAALTIGAIPWGTVLLDGKPIGRTPIDHLAVPAGHHAISVTFGGEDPPRTLSYTVDLATGEAKDLVADFTRP